MIELFILGLVLSLIGIILLEQKKLKDKISGLMAKIADLIEKLIKRNEQALDDFSIQMSSLKLKINALENENKWMNDRFYELQSRVKNLEFKIKKCSQNNHLNTVSRRFVMNNL